MTCRTACFAVEIAGDKKATKDLLRDAGIPVPKGTTVYMQEELKSAINWLGYPLVIKPLDGNHGKGASINIKNLKDAQKGFEEAQKFSSGVMVEQYIEGFDFRMLVINGKFVAAAMRTPAIVTGDDTSTISHLIEQGNSDPRRGIGYEKAFTKMNIDKHPQKHRTDCGIPIIAVTGTNGKITTTRLLTHMVKSGGRLHHHRRHLYTGKMLEKGDTTGSYSAAFVLKDPVVNFAVRECARGGLLRSGLGFKMCNIGIVTNISSDHLRLRDIHTLEDLAKVKAVILMSVSKVGYTILNADNDLEYAMAKEVDCKVAFFSMDENYPFILKHIAVGGIAAMFENGYISIFKNSYKIRIDRVADVPLSFGGKAKFNIENTLAATLRGYLSHLAIEDIKMALRTFIP